VQALTPFLDAGRISPEKPQSNGHNAKEKK